MGYKVFPGTNVVWPGKYTSSVVTRMFSSLCQEKLGIIQDILYTCCFTYKKSGSKTSTPFLAIKREGSRWERISQRPSAQFMQKHQDRERGEKSWRDFIEKMNGSRDPVNDSDFFRERKREEDIPSKGHDQESPNFQGHPWLSNVTAA